MTQADLIIVGLLILIALLVGGAIGHHTRSAIIRKTGGTGDEAVILDELKDCEDQLAETTRELRHARQVADVYQELSSKRKKDLDA